MKARIIKISWGIVLVALGGLLLANTLGYINLSLITRQGWPIFLAGLSAIFFLWYFLAGLRHWGLLFPALLSAALAMITSVLAGNHSGAMIAVSILASIGIPFYVGYLVERRHWGLLIPAWIMTVVACIVFLSEGANSDLIGGFVLYAIALPFLIVYFANRQHVWALIVGGILAFIGLFPLLTPILPGDFAGPVIMFIFTLPFFATYFALKKAWWALIPAGIFASIGVVALLDVLFPSDTYLEVSGIHFGVYTAVLLLGFALTFGLLWLLRSTQPTAWAKVPALVLLIASLIAFLWWGTLNDFVPAVILLVIGMALIFSAVLKRRGSVDLPTA
jgi:hypothetical protein